MTKTLRNDISLKFFILSFFALSSLCLVSSTQTIHINVLFSLFFFIFCFLQYVYIIVKHKLSTNNNRLFFFFGIISQLLPVIINLLDRYSLKSLYTLFQLYHALCFTFSPILSLNFVIYFSTSLFNRYFKSVSKCLTSLFICFLLSQ